MGRHMRMLNLAASLEDLYLDAQHAANHYLND